MFISLYMPVVCVWRVTSRARALALPLAPPSTHEPAPPPIAGGPRPNALRVHLTRARGLAAMDGSLFGAGGTSDPYVTVEYAGAKHKSATKKRTLDPDWTAKARPPPPVPSHRRGV
jgi:hypothetical protein